MRVTGLSAMSNVSLLAAQAREFRPHEVCVADAALAADLARELAGVSPFPRLLAGAEGLAELAASGVCGEEIVLNAVVGSAGILPTLAAIDAGQDVALANKETLVAAGYHVMRAAGERGVTVRPVDSEHSAVWQCLWGEDRARVARVILTASGGPFRDREDLSDVTPEAAVAHPNWRMGPKISVDSATMMNKALEVVEARWLLGIPVEAIEILVHRESIVHSMVEFVDGSVKAQLGTADMRTPIQVALTYPHRLPGLASGLELATIGSLTFERPDVNRFPAVGLGHAALRRGGVVPAVMSAANEEAVNLFLSGKIRFQDITRLVIRSMDASPDVDSASLDDIALADRWAREYVRGRCSECTR
jgi:1-deoxy-D-xylulose-5-phosphate reductoisomerase